MQTITADAPSEALSVAIARADVINTGYRRGNRIADRVLPGIIWTIVALVVAFLLLPLIVIIGTSLNEITVIFPPQNISFSSYGKVPSYIYESMWTSVQIGVLAALISAVLALPTSLALLRGKSRFSVPLRALFMSGLQVPAIVLGLALYQFYGYLTEAGIPMSGSFIGLLIGHILSVFPFVLSTMAARLAVLDPSLEHAAAGLGAGLIRTTASITLPLLKPAIISGLFLAFLVSFDDVSISLFLVSGQMTTFPVALLSSSEQALQPWLFCVSAIVVVASALICGLVDRVFGLRTVLASQ